jgi:hypothetical protein
MPFVLMCPHPKTALATTDMLFVFGNYQSIKNAEAIFSRPLKSSTTGVIAGYQEPVTTPVHRKRDDADSKINVAVIQSIAQSVASSLDSP